LGSFLKKKERKRRRTSVQLARKKKKVQPKYYQILSNSKERSISRSKVELGFHTYHHVFTLYPLPSYIPIHIFHTHAYLDLIV
jgi:hypothetical protein